MNYSDLKKEVKEIAEIAESLPDRYREKCFDILFAKLLEQIPARKVEKKIEEEKGAATRVDPAGTLPKFTIPAKVRAFIKRNELSEEDINSLALIEGDEFHFILEPTSNQNSTAQIHWSLLLALKAALLGGDMEVDPEAVRSICIEKGVYDKNNFAATFKKSTYAMLFNGTMDHQGKAQKLTKEGETALSTLIKSLIKK